MQLVIFNYVFTGKFNANKQHKQIVFMIQSAMIIVIYFVIQMLREAMLAELLPIFKISYKEVIQSASLP